jgi:hypothetical protein
MEVAGFSNGSYQDLGYSIGDYIRIGGVTETIGDLQPDDVNGIHEIVKFGDNLDEYSYYRDSFFVKVDATPGLDSTVQAWTQPVPTGDAPPAVEELAEAETDSTPTVTEPLPTTHWIGTRRVNEMNVAMNVAGYQAEAYDLTYEVGDQIMIGGYTEHNAVLTGFTGLEPDFINGLHTISGFHTSPDPTSDHHYSFDVILPDFTGAEEFKISIQAWTQPNSV